MSLDHRRAFDGSIRRRIHLFRHGDVSYVQEDGTRVPDSRAVPLTKRGLEQADEMGTFLSHVTYDRAICSGLPRTLQTAQGILKDRPLELEHMLPFEEIRSNPERYQTLENLNQVAYSFSNAHEPGARYGDGEVFADCEARVIGALKEVLLEDHWRHLALIAHGGVNRVILGWALGVGLKAFSSFEQNTCCLNVIDIDTHPETREIVRTLVRGVNITTYDQTRCDDHLTTLEGLAERFRPAFEQGKELI